MPAPASLDADDRAVWHLLAQTVRASLIDDIEHRAARIEIDRLRRLASQPPKGSGAIDPDEREPGEWAAMLAAGEMGEFEFAARLAAALAARDDDWPELLGLAGTVRRGWTPPGAIASAFDAGRTLAPRDRARAFMKHIINRHNID